MKLRVGTTKGLITFCRVGQKWSLEHKDFLGLPVSMIHQNGDQLWVALSIKHWGPKMHCSTDQGVSWQEITVPKYPESAEIKPGIPATLGLIWSMASSADHLWIGTEPGGLFRSVNNGTSFELMETLWNHPSRVDHWFGGGRNFPGIHSICIDPRDHGHVYIGVSCAGVFETRDAGLTWKPANSGLRADYLPNPWVEVGHDPHNMKICEQQPEVIWQQNHCGVFRSTDAGASWLDVTGKDGTGAYGFGLVIDHTDASRAWIIPAQSDEMRVARDLRLTVCETQDGGQSWLKRNQGLPQSDCFDLVFRHAFTKHQHLLAFGTTNGNLFISEDEGLSWKCVNHHLPPIHVLDFSL